MNNDQIWQAVLGEIELNLSKANFTTWFKNTFISSFEDGKMIICVPNTFTKTWLEKKYHDKIAKALESICNEKIKEIYYKIEIKKNNPMDELLKKIKIKKDEINQEPILTNRFGLNNRYVFKNFVVGRGNELAHAASQAVAANPGNAYNPLFIYGGVGLGKTHLLQAIGHEVSKKTDKILYVTSEKFSNDYINSVKSGNAKEFKDRYRNVDLLLLDDVQFMAGKDGTQQEFFHTFNELHQANKQIVLTSDRQPKSIPALEKRLLSRFEWGMIADVTRPDLETMIAILETKCKEKNYNLEASILHFIAENVQNNIRELEGALNRIIAFHEFNNTQPTIDSTRHILSNLLISTKSKSITGKNIIDSVSSFFGINIKDIVGKSRKKELVYPRQITMYLMREETNTSYPTIGYELGGRDHTTAMHAYNKLKKEITENEKIKQDIESVKQLIYNSNN
ncbi:MAG: Chromosomal replication initiator protein DnaA [Candidatus Falkowbacteria bacterium GW2011_GWC2_38_22]|uniref:Chromosomal replication initiator protein DnaA n=1 Tax=Candidatus Falkowbacteria bacterium GW2011_GWE1_38_31 TaxID=1618638 RepID=A0A0G0MWR2_9BACT|nr:MAG: Chromosomal replication initiator protein DnaA [Candidatus Falkowbacteria bacterium GW2011_GWF2_38_1205]KKQ60415.1 MAG: Chromosomal replication initiator protein DnaA [Candidatus Falkowbacteria bacterium GW2011_GWC2_38_22]KKQ62462.1 MAG: Chromosomal replication initiator protein DnaA [Candidatus Falkowbacteria bacterium GW2011_GWF1_38_22]KKQ64533.1 MAG: Chromosomal replication initiator protein DnaA [Candidatus Falkowbacteria bacterium GW2011_GWE2_38_254]KKQ69371.1 MAG: Chromosomal repl